MNISIILLGLLPLIVFAIVDSFFSFKRALIGAMLAAALEVGINLYLFGELDSFSWFNLALIVCFAGIAWRFGSPKFFKLQPSIVSFCLGCFLVVSYLMGEPVLMTMTVKYKEQLAELITTLDFRQLIENPRVLAWLSECTLGVGVAHLVHSALTYVAATRWKNLAWILSRASIYLLIMIAAKVAALRVF